jgi:hypothetical protein
VTKDDVFDGEGNLLKDLPKGIVGTSNAKLTSEVRSMMEELIHHAEGSDNGLQILQDRFFAFGQDMDILLPKRMTSQGEEIEAFVGCPIPGEVIIQPPNEIKSVGRCKRIKPGQKLKKSNDSMEKKQRGSSMCRSCKQVGNHDARNCPLRKNATQS